jgi:hypothetical protein
MKKILLACVCLTVFHFGFSQPQPAAGNSAGTTSISFDNTTLKTLHFFATVTNNDNIIAAMKQNKIDLKTDGKDRDGNRLVAFQVPSGKLEFCYSTGKKLIYIRMDLPKANGKALAEVVYELESKQFTKKITRKNAFTEDAMTAAFINKNYPYTYLVYNMPEHNSLFLFNPEFDNLESFELH